MKKQPNPVAKGLLDQAGVELTGVVEHNAPGASDLIGWMFVIVLVYLALSGKLF